jgi:hypothetical protein
MSAEMMRLELPSYIQIVDAICLFALLSLHTLQCFLSLTNSQTHLFDFALVLHTLAYFATPRSALSSDLWSPNHITFVFVGRKRLDKEQDVRPTVQPLVR